MDLWKNHIAKGNTGMFPLLLGLESEEVYHEVSSFIETTWKNCRTKLRSIFPPFQNKCDSGRAPFSKSSAQLENLWAAVCALKMRFTNLSLANFWIPIKKKSFHSKENNGHHAAVFNSLHLWTGLFISGENEICPCSKFMPELRAY